MAALTEAAPAKVNLFLHVTGRRADGYHLLDSLAVFGPAADTLTATRAEALSLTLAGPFGESLAAEPDNLVLRAARALAAEAQVTAGATLHLEKHLPVASGIGGGSADAAAALRLLNRLWRCELGEAALARIAAPLGADIPVCVASRPARMQGIGEVITPGPALPECGLLLVNPRVPVATPAVFRARQGGFSPLAELPVAWPDAEAMVADLARLTNDLEAPALSLCPVIGDVLCALRATPGCLLARMSGSGATCFGIFATPGAAIAAARAMPEAWWSAGGALLP
ncbi:4-(cytidine 5'-diphospho)-2-C-methyl-D-erythritol kinase [Roseococcus sp. SDR]|uniref:4-(cytidine 5'-diphospho)-2-C-methyl-D-erythritol kinase n=1 Tax=Roseococcus sp. SDR TaxID=2835532 RepID=UPI001BCE2199|nr:4-(cytidine 5'-diphospho)-2-C-methyl-D-erythritol kinase [Roseococcus sp. SDR]MBS7788920.1 4-(cytidine 5'-diphospho)-2-C-methyl-D-erythritol kinase [Roseococcus sp. SDR]MBV1844234.1 4-(cytidine 5'-diphospho)-2-C-methyl-D-erythritol kinase [Roseococcus sp. SDR]